MTTDKALLTVPEAAHRLSIGKTKLYELIDAGEIPAIRIGVAVRIPAGAIDAWVARQTAEQAPSAARRAER
jgi:excisionase family DNA binding protein